MPKAGLWKWLRSLEEKAALRRRTTREAALPPRGLTGDGERMLPLIFQRLREGGMRPGDIITPLAFHRAILNDPELREMAHCLAEKAGGLVPDRPPCGLRELPTENEP